MNRFQQLAQQAGMGQERWNTTEQFQKFLDNYALLIVQECQECVRDVVQDQSSELTWVAADQVQKRIKEHWQID